MLVLSVAASTTPQTPTESKTIFNHDGIHGNACTGHRLVAVLVRDHRKASKVYPYSMDMSSSLLLNIDPGLPMDCDPSSELQKPAAIGSLCSPSGKSSTVAVQGRVHCWSRSSKQVRDLAVIHAAVAFGVAIKILQNKLSHK